MRASIKRINAFSKQWVSQQHEPGAVKRAGKKKSFGNKRFLKVRKIIIIIIKDEIIWRNHSNIKEEAIKKQRI